MSVKRVEMDTGASVFVDFAKMTANISGSRADVLKATDMVNALTVRFPLGLYAFLIDALASGGEGNDV